MARFLLNLMRPLIGLSFLFAALMAVAIVAGNTVTGQWLAAPTQTGFRLIDIDRNTSVEILLHPDASRGGLTWSPDGRYLVLTGEHADGAQGLHLLDTRSGQLSELVAGAATDLTPQWSPTGSAIAFTSFRDGNFEIYTYDTETAELRNLSNHDGDDRFPVWSPDGERIAFVASRDNRYDIYDLYVIDVESERIRQVTETQLIRSPPVWSPDGRMLAYRSEFNGSIEVVTTGGLPQFRIDDDHNYYQPNWSPDGTTLAFYADRGRRYTDVYLTRDKGINFIRLTNIPGNEFSPVWSPDGDSLVFVAASDARNIRSGSDIYIVNADGTDMRRLTFSRDIVGAPSWQPQ